MWATYFVVRNIKSQVVDSNIEPSSFYLFLHAHFVQISWIAELSVQVQSTSCKGVVWMIFWQKVEIKMSFSRECPENKLKDSMAEVYELFLGWKTISNRKNGKKKEWAGDDSEGGSNVYEAAEEVKHGP